MPLDCVMDFSSPFPLTRDCITLNLMLYQVSHPFHSVIINTKMSQAIILTTRPALLHLAKARITNQGIPTRNDVFEKFSRTCIDAAERSLSVLCAAKEQNLIGESYMCSVFEHLTNHTSSAIWFLRSRCSLLRRICIDPGWECLLRRAENGSGSRLKTSHEFVRLSCRTREQSFLMSQI